jgi:hypothetical protein
MDAARIAFRNAAAWRRHDTAGGRAHERAEPECGRCAGRVCVCARVASAVPGQGTRESCPSSVRVSRFVVTIVMCRRESTRPNLSSEDPPETTRLGKDCQTPRANERPRTCARCPVGGGPTSPRRDRSRRWGPPRTSGRVTHVRGVKRRGPPDLIQRFEGGRSTARDIVSPLPRDHGRHWPIMFGTQTLGRLILATDKSVRCLMLEICLGGGDKSSNQGAT